MPKPLRNNPPDASNVAPKTIEIKAPRTQGRRQFSGADVVRGCREPNAGHAGQSWPCGQRRHQQTRARIGLAQAL